MFSASRTRAPGSKWLALGLVLWSLYGRAEPARFDFYLLALSVAPAFCEDAPQRKRAFAQCKALTERGFRAVPLTLHGLWPNRLDRRHPAYCGGRSARPFCALPALTLPTDTRAALRHAMPAVADCLDRHQWAKHGSCSGLAQAEYFAASAALSARVNRAIGGEIARHMGREVDLEHLRERLRASDPPLEHALVFECRTPRTADLAKRRPMLREIRVHFTRDPVTGAPGRPLPYVRAGARHHNSGCPRGRAYVDSPLD